jgi:transcriptional regulator with XRE-family HTH domain
MQIDKQAVGIRLREFGESRFPKIKDFAEALGMPPSSLQSSYFNGRSLPGAELLLKLMNLGCDCNWLLTGDGDNEIKSVKNKSPDDCVDRIKELEEENRLLRDRISQITLLTQAIDTIKKTKKKRGT